jgi:hypothetical protein
MALARALYNLPKLTDEFTSFLRSQREMAPDEDLMTQALVAGKLFDVDFPDKEALRRMADYGSREKMRVYPAHHRTNILPADEEYPYESYGAAQRIENRLGRNLTEVERSRLGNYYFSTKDEPIDFYLRALEDIDDAGQTRRNIQIRNEIYGRKTKEDIQGLDNLAYDALRYARKARLEAQRRMALEYLMGGLD